MAPHLTMAMIAKTKTTLHGFKGFLVIESTDSLDLVAVYTTGGRGEQVSAIDVEQIKERKL